MSPLATVVSVGHRVLDALAVDVLAGGITVGNGPAPNPVSLTPYSCHKKTLRKVFHYFFIFQLNSYLNSSPVL